MYFLPRRLTYCSQILSNCNVPVVASSTGDPAGFLLSVSSSRRLSECLRPTTQKGEETLLVRPRTTYWASRTSSERVDQAPGKPAEPDNIIIRGRSAEKQAIPCEVGPDNHWEDKLEPKPIRQHVKRDRGNVINTCRELGQTRDKGSC